MSKSSEVFFHLGLAGSLPGPPSNNNNTLIITSPYVNDGYQRPEVKQGSAAFVLDLDLDPSVPRILTNGGYMPGIAISGDYGKALPAKNQHPDDVTQREGGHHAHARPEAVAEPPREPDVAAEMGGQRAEVSCVDIVLGPRGSNLLDIQVKDGGREGKGRGEGMGRGNRESCINISLANSKSPLIKLDNASVLKMEAIPPRDVSSKRPPNLIVTGQTSQGHVHLRTLVLHPGADGADGTSRPLSPPGVRLAKCHAPIPAQPAEVRRVRLPMSFHETLPLDASSSAPGGLLLPHGGLLLPPSGLLLPPSGGSAHHFRFSPKLARRPSRLQTVPELDPCGEFSPPIAPSNGSTPPAPPQTAPPGVQTVPRREDREGEEGEEGWSEVNGDRSELFKSVVNFQFDPHRRETVPVLPLAPSVLPPSVLPQPLGLPLSLSVLPQSRVPPPTPVLPPPLVFPPSSVLPPPLPVFPPPPAPPSASVPSPPHSVLPPHPSVLPPHHSVLPPPPPVLPPPPAPPSASVPSPPHSVLPRHTSVLPPPLPVFPPPPAPPSASVPSPPYSVLPRHPSVLPPPPPVLPPPSPALPPPSPVHPQLSPALLPRPPLPPPPPPPPTLHLQDLWKAGLDHSVHVSVPTGRSQEAGFLQTELHLEETLRVELPPPPTCLPSYSPSSSSSPPRVQRLPAQPEAETPAASEGDAHRPETDSEDASESGDDEHPDYPRASGLEPTTTTTTTTTTVDSASRDPEQQSRAERHRICDISDDDGLRVWTRNARVSGSGDRHGWVGAVGVKEEEEEDSAPSMEKVKSIASRLKLATRRPSVVAWRQRVIGKPLGSWTNATSGGNRKWSMRDFGDVEDESQESEWADDRQARVSEALSWLRRELLYMKEQDQSLARYLITLRHDIHQVKLARCSAKHQEAIDDAADELEEARHLAGHSDTPPLCLSTPLKQCGVTRMNINSRRFSVF